MKRAILILVLFMPFVLQAQITTGQEAAIDSLFTGWNQPGHPGGTVAIMKNGEIIYSKSFGLASLEYLVPNSTATQFNIASVSKQFTAMGMVLLHREGKLSVDDDIRKHLPELPDFGETVTIRHMLHHTSGLRSLHALLGMAGWRGDDLRTNDDINRFMLNQQDLNFNPGAEYLYCNTGFMLMVNIIEKITEENFRNWMQANIFEPLGMRNTYVEDQYNSVMPGNATSYEVNETGGYNREVEYWGYVGSGNIHTTAEDLLKWNKNFYAPEPGWEEAFSMIQTTDPFNDGRTHNYAFGVNVDTYKGLKRVQHGGSIGGFRANSCTFPDQQMNLAVLTNFNRGNPGGKVAAIADILLPVQEKVLPDGISLQAKQLKKITGNYWDERTNNQLKIRVENDTLRYGSSENSLRPLIPVSANTFIVQNSPDRTLVFNSKEEKVTITNPGSNTYTFNKYDPNKSKEAVSQLTGRYYSEELETAYVIKELEGQLIHLHPRHGKGGFQSIKKDTFAGNYPLSVVEFSRNDEGIVTGMYASNGRARDVWFRKIDEKTLISDKSD